MKKICVITGSRADYGLLYWTLKELQASPIFDLQIVATCMHLSAKFGNTLEIIQKDGFTIHKTVDLGDLGDTRQSVISQVSCGLTGFFQAYGELNPDLVVILGDRYEMLAAAQAAFFSDIPIAHIHGGEVTQGAFDDAIRHAITKLATFHFASTEIYASRIVRMGEHPSRVANVGALGLENIRKLKLLTKPEIEENLGFSLRAKNVLVTYHPVTALSENAVPALLDSLNELPDSGQIITMPNSDPGHEMIFEKMKKYAQSKSNVYLSENLGTLRYLSLMSICDAVVGNSSSGIIEAPFMGTPTVNIGARQLGRIKPESVIDVDADAGSIKKGLQSAFRSKFKPSQMYGTGESAEKIVAFLKSANFETKTGFYDE